MSVLPLTNDYGLYILYIYKQIYKARYGPFFQEMTETISGNHCTYPRRDGQAEWAPE